MKLRTLVGAFGIVLVLGGCASAGGVSSARSGNTIPRQEIEAYSGDNVYLLIQSYHPAWLRARGRTSMGLAAPVMVYIDAMPQPDGVESLRNLRPQQVEEITYLDSRAATNRYGTGHTNGAILVKLK